MAAAQQAPEKVDLHIRNRNRQAYNLEALCTAVPALKNYITENKYGSLSVNFSLPEAVRLLNKGLLHVYYGIESWDFPTENLCPPIPGRADYLHYLADLLAAGNSGTIPTQATGLDIGVGASCIYPIIGAVEYGWNFIGSDIDAQSTASAEAIVAANEKLRGKVEIRLQKEPRDLFTGIIKNGERIDFTLCNPPFHASAADAQRGTRRKLRNLTGKSKGELNFAGVSNELITEGGERAFIAQMIEESTRYKKQCLWFTCLVSKGENLPEIFDHLDDIEAEQVRTIEMGTGNKITRFVAWTFCTKEVEKSWWR